MKKRKPVAKRKQYIRDNATRATNPKSEFVEIPMDPETLEKVAHQNATWQQLIKDDPGSDHDEVETRMRQEEKLKQIFQAASQVLTEVQFKIFVMRYVYDLKQREIAKQMGRHQSYIPEVLKASVKKIKKRLEAEGLL